MRTPEKKKQRHTSKRTNERNQSIVLLSCDVFSFVSYIPTTLLCCISVYVCVCVRVQNEIRNYQKGYQIQSKQLVNVYLNEQHPHKRCAPTPCKTYKVDEKHRMKHSELGKPRINSVWQKADGIQANGRHRASERKNERNVFRSDK